MGEQHTTRNTFLNSRVILTPQHSCPMEGFGQTVFNNIIDTEQMRGLLKRGHGIWYLIVVGLTFIVVVSIAGLASKGATIAAALQDIWRRQPGDSSVQRSQAEPISHRAWFEAWTVNYEMYILYMEI